MAELEESLRALRAIVQQEADKAALLAQAAEHLGAYEKALQDRAQAEELAATAKAEATRLVEEMNQRSAALEAFLAGEQAKKDAAVQATRKAEADHQARAQQARTVTDQAIAAMDAEVAAKRALRLTAANEAVTLYRQAEQRILKDVPLIPLFYLSVDHVFQAGVQNAQPSALGAPYRSLHKVWLKAVPNP